jgi:hypothetical protein
MRARRVRNKKVRQTSNSALKFALGLLISLLLPLRSDIPAPTSAPHARRAPASESSPKWEAYSISRPDIIGPDGSLTITPREHPEFNADWRRLRESHLDLVAQLLELYPDETLYFLARDSELLYDAAQFLLRDNPSARTRIRILNISRANMRADHVLDYLT